MMMPLPLPGAGRPHKDHSPDELHLAVLTGRSKRIKNMLQKGVHIESVNSRGQTPLFCACWGGDVEIVTLLLSLGANPNRPCGSTGATPVHAACYRGSRRVLRLLVEAGANFNVDDTSGRTPRDYAEKQPAPIRRQKILTYLDLILRMTLHRGGTLVPHRPPLGGIGASDTSPITPTNTLSRGGSGGTLGDSKSSLTKSTLSLSKKSVANVWGACLGVGQENPNNKYGRSPEKTMTLSKSVSCHLLDQLCVTTSLPLISRDQLKRPQVTELAYTCGGPTVYSPYTWLGTPVTVRRPTPALAKTTSAGGKPDQDAVLSLLEELAILRRLRHPAFLEVMAACHVTNVTPDHVTLVYQHVPYGSLYHHLHVMHRDLSVCGAVEMLTGVVEGLLFLHAHSWLHSGISSHALHLVSPTHAKLGGFENAVQVKAKGGCSMKAEELKKATWLMPWQAPEILQDAMVSVKSEVYSLSAVIWEMWSGMPPWSGVSDDEIKERVCGGERLPLLVGTPPSLVMYLTQYGLQWNSHERDLDLHEIHTLLKSLKVQVDEDERVPAVSSWGPPSVPNTPVIGRSANHSSNPNNNQTNATNIINNFRNNRTLSSSCVSSTCSSPLISASARHSTEVNPSQYLHFVTIDQLSSSSYSSDNIANRPNSLNVKSAALTQSSAKTSDEGIATKAPQPPTELPKRQLHLVHKDAPSQKPLFLRNQTPKAESKYSPGMVTSTPHRQINLANNKPDLLPSKFTPKTNCFQPGTPDILTRSSMNPIKPRTIRGRFSKTPADCSDSDSSADGTVRQKESYQFISNSAKRAFFTDSEGNSQSPSPTHESNYRKSSVSSLSKVPGDLSAEKMVGRQTKDVSSRSGFEPQESRGMIRTDVVRRGLSLSNLLNIPGTSVVSRTFSHVSLCSAESVAAVGGTPQGAESRKPQRTISQVTLTFKKLSTDCSSSSSRDELEQVNCRGKLTTKPEGADRAIEGATCNATPPSSVVSRDRRSSSLTKTVQQSNSKRSSCHEMTAIKPASHQLTRHSSSCSLSSQGPPSPVHQFVGGQPGNSLPASPQHSSKTSIRRPLSETFGGSLATDAIRINPRKQIENNKMRTKKFRRKQKLELEEEFIDDEFNASLYNAPHMQLSVGSSENLLDTRLSSSVMADDSDIFSPVLGPTHKLSSPPPLFTPCRTPPFRPSLHTHLNVLPENSDEDLSLTIKDIINSTARNADEKTVADTIDVETKSRTEASGRDDDDDCSDKEKSVSSSSDSEFNISYELKKEYDPLKSVQLLRNMSKSVSLYLPRYSVGSDSEESEK